MKTITTLALLLISSTVLMAQMDRNHKVALNDSEVPVPVRVSQQNHFPNGFVINWHSYSNLPDPSEKENYYISTFKKQGSRSFKAYFDGEGNVIAKITFLPTYTLPESIQESVNNAYLNSKIKSGDLIELYDRDMTLYRVRVNTEGLLQYMYYDRYARMLDPRRLPTELFALN